MNKAKIKKAIQRMLIDSHQGVSEKYRDYIKSGGRGDHELKKLCRAVEFNLKHRLGNKPLYRPLKELRLPESSSTKRPGIDELIAGLKGYDVISFDVFDTLIFRTVEDPKDVFSLLEAKNGIPGFAGKRVEAERLCRESGPYIARAGGPCGDTASKAGKPCAETTLDQIYARLAGELSIDKAAAIQAEIEVELAVCVPNPYMKRIYSELVRLGKRVIAVSDMYLPKCAIESILKNCGYSFSDIFISCEYGVGKRDGELQRIAEKKLKSEQNTQSAHKLKGEQNTQSLQKLKNISGPKLSFVHIGDNKRSDVEGSEKAGWDTVYYLSIRMQGNEYRHHGMTSLQSSFYKGLVNIRLHRGAGKCGALYEFGYAYGGIMAMGFAQYINEKVKKDKIDQLIFLGRDMCTVHSVYQKYFSNDGCDTAYIPFSRYAAYRLSMKQCRRDFYAKVVRHWAHSATKKSIGEVLDITGISGLKSHLAKAGLSAGDPFNMAVAERLEPLFDKYGAELIVNCREQVELAGEFFGGLIGDHKNIRIVDLGWSGTCPILLSGFIREHLTGEGDTARALSGIPSSGEGDTARALSGIQSPGESDTARALSGIPSPGERINCDNLANSHIEVSGLLMAMIDSRETRTALAGGALESYMFSPEHNRDNLLFHMSSVADTDYRNILMEILFSEDRPSFLGYKRLADGSVGFSYSADEGNSAIIRAIHRGILDFCDDYHRHCVSRFPELKPISGREAYLPIAALSEAKDYCIRLLRDYRVSEQSGNLRTADFHTLKEIYGG